MLFIRCCLCSGLPAGRPDLRLAEPADSIGGLSMRGKKVLFILSLTVLVLFLLVGVFADFLAPCDPNAVDMANGLAAPSTEHWLGTDHIGRDLLSRLIYGSRSSVFIAFFATGCTLLLGMTIGWCPVIWGMDRSTDSGCGQYLPRNPQRRFCGRHPGTAGPRYAQSADRHCGQLLGWILPYCAQSSSGDPRAALYRGRTGHGRRELYIMRRHILPNILLPLLVLIATRIALRCSPWPP